MKRLRGIALLGCVSVFAVSTHAFAQSDQAPQESEVAESDIIVTGSRVAANGDDSPTPVTVISTQQMAEVKPGNLADQLNELPQFSGSQGQGSRAEAGSANTGVPNAQANVLNLRNFGFTRNLILYDGHRVAPNSPNGTVDIDMIPQLLLKRVDVVTGGASAVYGSDAVTGVVNFITDTRFNGLKVNAFAGISSRGDGGTQDIGLAWGGDLGDRAHLLMSYQFRNDEGIDHRSAREWGRKRYQIGTVGTVAGVTTQRFVSLAGRPGASFGGTISSIGAPANPFNGFYFASPGVLAPVTGDFVNSNVAGNSTGSYFEPSLKSSMEKHQAYGRFDYELAESVRFYIRGAYTKNDNAGFAISNPTYVAANGSNVHPIFVTNPYLPAAIAGQMTAAGVTRFGINKVHSGPGMDQYRQLTKAFGENWSIDVGFNGTFGGTWKWELAALHSSNKLRVQQTNAINGKKLAAALDAVPNPNGTGSPVCYVSTQPQFASLYPGCVPYASIFGPTISEAEADWIFDPLNVTTKTKMTDLEGFVSGSPFSTWAGPVNVALSAQARKLTYEVISGSTPATLANPLDCTGLRLITCTPTSLEYFQAESLSRPEISVSVKEAALEASVPLLRDVAFVRDLSISAAYRYTHYSTSGGISSWKAGLDWSPIDDLRFRATRSRDIRAPTLHELFQPQSVGNFGGRDELLGIALDGANGRPSPAGNILSGNESLRPERADSFTVGFVYTPSWAPGLSVALDYFDIRVKDAIVLLNGIDAATQLDCINSGGASATCALIVRAQGNCCTNAPNNQIIRAFSRPINIGRQFTKGADFELNYTKDIVGRPSNLRLLVSYQPENVLVDALNGLQTNNAGAGSGSVVGSGHAKWRGTLIANMDVTDNIRIGVQERYRGKLNWYPSYEGAGAPTFVLLDAPKNIPARFYTNLNVAFRTGPSEFFFNVQNLFDQKPAIFANPSTAPFPGLNGVAPGDDAIGRYFTAGVRAKF
ncbi:TonB-dependent receptor plug domain-containing protein [Sphingobium boeckii]|uniref:Outer membrane receptor protein involved in Fe transport n=1 Tax=Sphingobium boeckii TaxID=1082345 RepID=A0A7W9ALK6_9SPHN|nr:TonB-dependent receptor [Sphingobium boeckii]MBB5687763.1 outer membrane receptor protein involved in Fe transport [Sphingobium boeckii]